MPGAANEHEKLSQNSIPVETIRSATSGYFQQPRSSVKHIQTVLQRHFVYTSALIAPAVSGKRQNETWTRPTILSPALLRSANLLAVAVQETSVPI